MYSLWTHQKKKKEKLPTSNLDYLSNWRPINNRGRSFQDSWPRYKRVGLHFNTTNAISSPYWNSEPKEGMSFPGPWPLVCTLLQCSCLDWWCRISLEDGKAPSTVQGMLSHSLLSARSSFTLPQTNSKGSCKTHGFLFSHGVRKAACWPISQTA